MPSALSSEPLASTTEATRPSTISEKYSAGPNWSATLGQRRREQRDQQRGDRAGEERADRGGGQRRAGPALPRHLVAVERGDRPRTIRPAG